VTLRSAGPGSDDAGFHVYGSSGGTGAGGLTGVMGGTLAAASAHPWAMVCSNAFSVIAVILMLKSPPQR
jgi:hypothetical protein